MGGPIWDVVLPLLNTYARVPVAGLIADYEARAEAVPSEPHLATDIDAALEQRVLHVL